MAHTRQMGRNLRVTLKNGTDHTFNLDHFFEAYALKKNDGSPNGSRIKFINHDFIDTDEDYETLNMRIMVSEYQRLLMSMPQPVQMGRDAGAPDPPKSIRELQEEARSEYEPVPFARP